VIAWIECAGRMPYLAGIVGSVDEATRVQAEMPPRVAHSSRVQCHDDLVWPCFIIESSGTFALCTAEEGTSHVAELARAGVLDDDRRIAVYRIVEPFLPDVPGRDEMGRLPHVHLGATDAARIAASGIASLFQTGSER
jgi:hypothetical protein